MHPPQGANLKGLRDLAAKPRKEKELMPAHLKKNKYGVWYLVDGFTKVTQDQNEREAEVRLKQYNRASSA